MLAISSIAAGLTALIVIVQSIIEKRKHRQKYEWILKKTYTVLRSSSQCQVPVTELLVGDVVCPNMHD